MQTDMVIVKLGVWGRLIFIAVGGCCIVLSVLVAVCFLGPGCLGYNYLYKKKNEKKKISQQFPVGDDFLLSDVGSTAVVTLYNIDHSFKKTPVNCRTSVCSTISGTSITSSSTASRTSVGFLPMPTISLIFQYVPPSPGKLIIFLRHVDGLPGKDFPHQTEVVVELRLMAGDKLHWSVVSRAIRNTRSPEYNSEFSVPASLEDIQKWCLSITVYDKDRFKGYRELAAMEMFLSDLGQSLFTGQLVPHASLMAHYQKEYGNLLLGLSYLPTAQRLTVSIVKAANIHCLNDLENKEFRPFARVFLLDGTGKVIQKKKTDELGQPDCARRCFFNSVLTLQITAPQILTATLLIILCYKTEAPSKPFLFEKDSYVEQVSRDGTIGRVALGNLVSGSKERKHWQVVQERSRRAVTAWHALR